MNRETGRPAFTKPRNVDAIASGRFERKTATRTAMLTPSPSRSVRPSTTDSGIPSRIVPRTIAMADDDESDLRSISVPSHPSPIDQEIADEERRGAQRTTR